jgi:hypothetical protein
MVDDENPRNYYFQSKQENDTDFIFLGRFEGSLIRKNVVHLVHWI